MNKEVIEATENICEKLGKQIIKVSHALDQEGGKLPAEDVTYLKELTGAVKNTQTILAMAGEYGSSERRGRDSMGRYTSRDSGYEGSGYYPMWRGAWDDGGGSMRGSYERSMHGDEREKIERMIRDTDDERVKRALTEAMRMM